MRHFDAWARQRTPNPAGRSSERLSSIINRANSRAAKDMPLEVRLVADRVGLTGDTHVRTVRVVTRSIGEHGNERARRMIPRLELRRLAYARLADSRALYAAGRYDAARYLCGYAVELALKARICRTLRWAGYPESRTEFANYGSFRIHDLQVLLELSGFEQPIRAAHDVHWGVVVKWHPALRYARAGTADPDETKRLITSARHLVRAL